MLKEKRRNIESSLRVLKVKEQRSVKYFALKKNASSATNVSTSTTNMSTMYESVSRDESMLEISDDDSVELDDPGPGLDDPGRSTTSFL